MSRQRRVRRSKEALSDAEIHLLLNHIHSLGGIADRDQLGPGETDTLRRLGLIRQVWIGNYALTEEGKRIRKRRGKSL